MLLGKLTRRDEPMKVNIDSSGLQARVHLEDQRRLAVFIATLESISSCSVTFSTGSTLTSGSLNDCDVLVATTRYPGAYAFCPEELEALKGFVRRGGGLLLMSNHGDLPGNNPHDMTRYDNAAAARFGIRLECTWFQNPARSELATCSGASLLTSHPIIGGGIGGPPVLTIVTNNCSSIVAGDQGYPLVSLSPEMEDLRNGYHAAGRLFAHALDAETGGDSMGDGRMATVADSGFIGNEDTEVPGPGLIGHGDNARFIKNVVRWLGRDLG